LTSGLIKQIPDGKRTLRKSLELTLQEAKDGKADVYFVDAAHFDIDIILSLRNKVRKYDASRSESKLLAVSLY
jgi:hypothetical protein